MLHFSLPSGCDFSRHQLSEEQIDAISNRFGPRGGEGVGSSVTDGNSPEPPLQQQQTTSISGGLFSEVSKKLGWHKDGADLQQAPPPGYVTNIFTQGYHFVFTF